MPTSTWIGRLAATVAIGCAAVVAITVAALAIPSLRAKLGFPAARSTSYAIGDHIDVPPSLYESSALTLFLFARSSCSACQRAKPMFAQLAAEIRRTSSANVVVITGSARHADEVAYTKDLGLEESQLVSLNFDGLRLKVVPTLVLVDGHGQVHYSSEGVISSAQQEDLLRTVTSLAAPR